MEIVSKTLFRLYHRAYTLIIQNVMANTIKDLQLDNNTISIAGEFAVLSQLALRGYDANMTLGHTKGVDILISNPKTGKMSRMEVKTHYRNTSTVSELFGHSFAWVMAEKHETLIDPNLYYCFVHISHPKYEFRFFIVPSNVVASYVKEQHKFWLENKGSTSNITIRQFRIGLDETGYKLETPLSSQYEDNWELIG